MTPKDEALRAAREALSSLYNACELRANREGGDFGADIGPAADQASAALSQIDAALAGEAVPATPSPVRPEDVSDEMVWKGIGKWFDTETFDGDMEQFGDAARRLIAWAMNNAPPVSGEISEAQVEAALDRFLGRHWRDWCNAQSCRIDMRAALEAAGRVR